MDNTLHSTITHHYDDDWSLSLVSTGGAEVDVEPDPGPVGLEEVPGVRLGQDEVEERVASRQETGHLGLGNKQLLTRSRQSEISRLCVDISRLRRSVARELD